MPISNIQYSDDSMSRVLACTPACHACTCKLQSDVSLVRHSLSFVTLDSGGDRNANSATTVIGSTSISVTVRAATATTYRCRFCSKLCGLGPACQQTHTVLSWPAANLQSTGRCATTTIGHASHSPQTRALSFETLQLLSLHARSSTAATGRTLA